MLEAVVRQRAKMSPEKIRALEAEDAIDETPPRHPVLDHPALNPKTQESLITLLDAYQRNGEADLTKRFDQIFPDSMVPANQPPVNQDETAS